MAQRQMPMARLLGELLDGFAVAPRPGAAQTGTTQAGTTQTGAAQTGTTQTDTAQTGISAADAAIPVRGLELDSRRLTPGAAFIALPGAARDGRNFLGLARDRGAAVIIAERGLTDLQRAAAGPVPVVEVPNLGVLVGTIARRYFGAPSQAMRLVGITGTNGKTTTARLTAQLLRASRGPCGVIGTLGATLDDTVAAAPNTTPDAISLQRQLADWSAQGVAQAVLEVSSHALDQGRINGVDIPIAVFTNLSHDHLDYHGSMDRYGAAKARLFTRPGVARALLNLDDPFAAHLARRTGAAVLGYSLSDPAADIFVERVRYHATGAEAQLHTPWGSGALHSPLLGEFNLANLLAAIGAALLVGEGAGEGASAGEAVNGSLNGGLNGSVAGAVNGGLNGGAAGGVNGGATGGVSGGAAGGVNGSAAGGVNGGADLARLLDALPALRGVPGRMEPVPNERGVQVVIDYAHSPDALAQVLAALRAHTRGRLICVFGCGGDRDRAKRPLMGAAASAGADRVVVTSDNPRTEPPEAIIADVCRGMDGGYEVEADRAAAIALALGMAAPGDCVLVAGKGHEAYQQVGAEYLPFSDRDQVQRVLGGGGVGGNGGGNEGGGE